MEQDKNEKNGVNWNDVPVHTVDDIIFSNSIEDYARVVGVPTGVYIGSYANRSGDNLDISILLDKKLACYQCDLLYETEDTLLAAYLDSAKFNGDLIEVMGKFDDEQDIEIYQIKIYDRVFDGIGSDESDEEKNPGFF